MPPPNKRGFKGSPTGVSPPSKRTDHADGFIENFIAAITDPRVGTSKYIYANSPN